MSESLSAGQEILAYCTSCRLDLAHTIVAMRGDRVAKVTCRTCQKSHVYRAPKGTDGAPKTKSKKSTAGAQSAEAAKAHEHEWDRLMQLNSAHPVKNYSQSEAYRVGEMIKHSNFGDGVVIRCIYPNKIEVTFRDQVRKLVQAHVGHSFPA